MSSAVMMDRGMMSASMGMSGSMPMAGQPAGMPGMCMVPRCTMKIEKCAGGMKMTCKCEDEMSAATLQNMCKMMAGGMLSMCCTMNGMMMCQCNMSMCKCECAMTKDGVCFTCTSGDQSCCEMIQACCDCVCGCMKAGCMCCVCMNNMPVCCCTTC